MAARSVGPAEPCGALARAAVAIALSLLTVPPARALKWRDPSPAESQIVEDPSKGLVGAVYLEKIQESTLDNFQVRVWAKILSKSGFDIGTVDGLEASAYDIEGRTLSPKGVATVLSSKDIHTATVVKAGGVSVERKGFTLPALEPGSFIEYTYKENGSFGSDTRYHAEILFQDKYPVLRQELRTPNPFSYSSTLRHQNGVRIDAKEERANYLYTATNAPPLKEEPYGRPIHERSAEAIFAYVFPGMGGNTLDEFWKSASKSVLTPLIKGWLIRPGRVEDRLKKIEGSREKDPIARLQALYRYVQTTVKNRSILRAGENAPKGGWKSNQDAGDTLSHGEGSPVDIAMVFASLLRADGWTFRVVLAPNREDRFFRRDIPSILQFEGWLIQVAHPQEPSRVTTLSFEHPLLEFGEVPWMHLGVDALALDLDSGASVVIKLPQSPAEANATKREWRVELSEDGDSTIERTSVWSGQPAFQVRANLYRQGKQDWEKDARNEYQKLDPPAQIESVAWENEEKNDAPLTGKMHFLRKGLASALPGGRLEFSPLQMLGHRNPFTSEIRNDPIYFPYPYLDEDTIKLTPPQGFVLDALPKPSEIQTEAGRYAVHLEKGDGNTVIVRREFELRRFAGAANLYSVYRSLFDSAAREDSAVSIVFKKAAPAPGKGF